MISREDQHVLGPVGQWAGTGAGKRETERGFQRGQVEGMSWTTGPDGRSITNKIRNECGQFRLRKKK